MSIYFRLLILVMLFVCVFVLVFAKRRGTKYLKEKLLRVLGAVVKHKKPVIISASIVLVIGLGLVIAAGIKHTIVSQKVWEQMDGKLYSELGDSWIRCYSFKDEQFAYENFSDDYQYGDITSYADCKLKIPLLGNTIEIWLDGSHCLDLILDKSGEITFTSYYQENLLQTTLEEIAQAKKEIRCGTHDYEEIVVTQPTCSKDGETKKICKNCGKEEKFTTTAAHRYTNNVCEKCGQQKPREKTSLKGNTWYTHTEISNLKVQNMIVSQAVVRANGRGVFVSGYYFCAHCNSIDDLSHTRVPEFNYDITEMYSCDICNKVTTVRLHIE